MTPRYLDGIIRIKNANAVGLTTVKLPYSKLMEQILILLKSRGRIEEFVVNQENIAKKNIVVNLSYRSGNPAISTVKLYSKPGRRIYVGTDSLKRVKGGHGLAVISTSRGILDEMSAMKAKQGGELLFAIW